MIVASDIPTRVAERWRSAGYWSDRLLIDAARSVAEQYPDRVAVADETGELSYGDAVAHGLRIAAWMAAMGVRAGNVVSIQLPNWREWYPVHLAALSLGAVVNPLLPQYGERELRHILATAKSRVLVTPAAHRSNRSFVPVSARLLDELPELAGVLVVRAPDRSLPAGVTRLESALEHPALGGMCRPTGDDVAVIAFSSGTESAPKGCVHTHNTMGFGLHEATRAYHLDSDTPIYMPSPVGHGTGFTWGLRLATHLGTTLVLQDKWDPVVGCDLISRYRCAFTLSATPFLQELVEQVRSHPGAYDLAGFRVFACGGTTIPRDLITEARRHLGCDVLACWGMTECFLATTVLPGDDEHTKVSCDGWAFPGVELRVLGEDGAQVPPGSEGELWIRGPNVMLGYVNPPPALAHFRAGDWLPTGDFAVLDEVGRLRIVGRKKDIIIRGGLNISPREIEDALLTHPRVAQVSVVGYSDQRLGEKACAVVVPADEAPLLLDDLTDFLRAKGFAPFKLPERLEVLDAVPVTPSGKVQKAQLRTWLAERIRAEAAGAEGVGQ